MMQQRYITKLRREGDYSWLKTLSKLLKQLLQQQAKFFVMGVMEKLQNLLQDQLYHRPSQVERNNFPQSGQAVTDLIINLPVSRKGENFTFVRFLIDKSNKCSYNISIATLGKMLNRNSNSNNRCMVSLTFPFNWPSY